jgi:hypothetical protein
MEVLYHQLVPICGTGRPKIKQGTDSTSFHRTRQRKPMAPPGNPKPMFKGYYYITPYCYHPHGRHQTTCINKSRHLHKQIVARSLKEDGHTAYDKDSALKQLEVLTTSIKGTLTRIYTLTSHSFHVLLRDLIPRGRRDKSNLFTHIKGAQTDHILNLRAHHNGKRKVGAEELTLEQLKPHFAAHTLQFIEDEYVEKDDDAAHYTWNDILNAVRTPKTTLFAWVDSFTLRTLRYSETIEKITGARLTKINKIIATNHKRRETHNLHIKQCLHGNQHSRRRI